MRISEKKAERAFTWGIFAFIVLRFVIAWGSFGDKNVNPFIFGFLDAITAWPYAHYTAKTVFALIRSDYKKSGISIAWWLFWFLVPYVYIIMVGQNIPSALWWGLGLWISIMFCVAIFGMIRKVVAGRKEILVENSD